MAGARWDLEPLFHKCRAVEQHTPRKQRALPLPLRVGRAVVPDEGEARPSVLQPVLIDFRVRAIGDAQDDGFREKAVCGRAVLARWRYHDDIRALELVRKHLELQIFPFTCAAHLPHQAHRKLRVAALQVDR